MPATLLPVPRARFFTPAGLPLAGGKVFTYAAGTTTPLASYTDYSGLVANTNPVILDANGEANIWLSNTLYKIVLKDSTDVTLWTVDNVGQNSVADLAAGFGIATNIASGATVDLGTLPSHFANITGATNISSFGASASLDAPVYLVKFNGTLTITHSASLLCPNSASITTAANDRAWCEYLGSGTWRIFDYMRANGQPIANLPYDSSAVSVASATTTDIGATGAGGILNRLVAITGTTTITSLGTSASSTAPQYFVRFTGTLTLTHNATSLILPTGANLITAAGDFAIFEYLGSGNWRCNSYYKNNGQPLAPIAPPLFTSADQTITSAGGLTIAHGLGRKPYSVRTTLVCQTGELGYTAGDEVEITTAGMQASAGNQGASVVTDTTNVNVRYGSSATVFVLVNKTTGATGNITNANWRLRLYAW